MIHQVLLILLHCLELIYLIDRYIIALDFFGQDFFSL